MKKINRGFTLVEMLVAITVFAVVTLIATGSVLKISDAYRRAQAIEGVMNNLNFSLETMTRDVRTGSTYYCSSLSAALSSSAGHPDGATRNCYQGSGSGVSVGNTLFFKPSNAPSAVAYQFFTPTDGIGYLQYCTPTACTRLTAPNVDIEDVRFFVDGTGLLDNLQPTVVVSIKGKVNLGGLRAIVFNLQTTMVQRALDY